MAPLMEPSPEGSDTAAPAHRSAGPPEMPFWGAGDPPFSRACEKR